MSVTVELSKDMERRLDELASRTGESREDLLRNALRNGIEDVEDYFSAAAVLKRVESGAEKTFPLDEVLRDLGLEN